MKTTEKSAYLFLLVLSLSLLAKFLPRLQTRSSSPCLEREIQSEEPLLLISFSQSHTHAAQLHNIRIKTTGWSGDEGAELLLPMNGHSHEGDCMWTGVSRILSHCLKGSHKGSWVGRQMQRLFLLHDTGSLMCLNYVYSLVNMTKFLKQERWYKSKRIIQGQYCQ